MNPLGIIDPKYTKEDWYKLRAHLLLPKPWLTIILKNFRDFGVATAQLAEVNRQYNDHLWNRMKMESEVSFLQKQYRVAGVPVKLMDKLNIVGKPDAQRTYNTILSNTKKFIENGDILYFYSELEDNALSASAEIVKKAVEENISCYMLSMPEFMEEVTTFERTDKLNKLENVELAVLYFIGREYVRKETGFVSSNLDGFIQKRKLNKKTTILTGNLDKDAFKKRYNMPLTASVLEFIDVGVVKTLKEIREGLRK